MSESEVIVIAVAVMSVLAFKYAIALLGFIEIAKLRKNERRGQNNWPEKR